MSDGRYTHIVKRESGYVAGWFQGEPPAEFVAECNRNVPGDPAHVEALDWAAWDDWAERTLEHTCEQGPLCEQMNSYLDLMADADEAAMDPISREYGFYPAEPTGDEAPCEHWTCLGIVHAQCEPCQVEAMEAMYGEAR